MAQTILLTNLEESVVTMLRAQLDFHHLSAADYVARLVRLQDSLDRMARADASAFESNRDYARRLLDEVGL